MLINEASSRLKSNALTFSGIFTLTQIGEFIGDHIHNPDVMDVPHGGVIAIGLGAAALATLAIDFVRQSSEN